MYVVCVTRNLRQQSESQLTTVMPLLLQSLLVLFIVMVVVCCASDVAVTVGACPTWRWFNYSSGECQCGSDVGGTIKCSEGNSPVYARFDVCLSWDNNSQMMFTSLCKFKRSRTSVTRRVFSELPQSPYNLSYDECELNNREGMFCGRCKKGFAPPIHLSSGSCINCSYCLQNPVFLSLFLVTEVLPLTIFYIIIMGLHVNLLTGPMMGYIIFCQSDINYIHIHPHTWNFILSQSWKDVVLWNRYVLFPLAGIWNLNFFSIFIPHICYSCNFHI